MAICQYSAKAIEAAGIPAARLLPSIKPGVIEKAALIAVMLALATFSRIAFAGVPHFKPMAGIIMISGIALGSPAGLFIGAASMFASNFYFGQGIWTVWQMASYGICGFAFGLAADRGLILRKRLAPLQLVLLSVAGGIFMILVAGPILDSSMLVFAPALAAINPSYVWGIFAAGIPVNCISAAATSLTLLVLTNMLLPHICSNRAKTYAGQGRRK